MDATLNIAVRAAREAGKIIARAADRVSSLTITEKGQNNFVTEVDKAAEAAIIDIISHSYPDHSFLTEETGIIENANRDAVWVIDPLDGTTNFLRGLPNYVVSIAFQFRGILEYAVIYHPITQDLFVAGRGKGAQLNDRRIRVTTRQKFEGALISIGLPRPKEYLASYLHFNQALQGQVGGIRRSGATALDLAYVAGGMLDMMWNMDSQPWDIAAGALLVKEAGGLIIDRHGGENYMENGFFFAGNPKIVKATLQALHPHLPK